MEAIRRQTIDDLIQAWAEDERLELIDGDIVQRPMARFEHGLAHSGLIEEIAPLKRQAGPARSWGEKGAADWCRSIDSRCGRRAHSVPLGSTRC
ncbi:hypothetical protein CCR96_15165 [Halochromatium roseum]|nr:hypothetical protein [Halochromatium roseum]